METLQTKVIEMLRQECRPVLNIKMYMKHIVVHTQSIDPASGRALKEQIICLIGQHYPQRDDILAIVITGEGMEDLEFEINKASASR
ncbi:MAG: hypothetical protein EOP45_19125 [Sphingobacteriaceae bacterium]|nr:MAG: hypothetical protein EOP45_19125 [Sphingobacteriaceae bacterium]